jgi:hypothetical protein
VNTVQTQERESPGARRARGTRGARSARGARGSPGARGAHGTPGGGKHAARRWQPSRKVEIIGLLFGLTAGLGLTLGWLLFFGGSGRPAAPADPAAQAPATAAPPVVPQSTGGPDPAGLNGEWAAYSDRSTCADWAGGDGLSAVRLSPTQIAWFFSDTDLGPAGPTSGFSRASGFVHNAVVVQTMSGQGSKFVTMTGGGACTGPGRITRSPSAVVQPPRAPGGQHDRYWDEDGMLIGGTAVKFYNRYLGGSVPFIPAGTVIATFPASTLSAAGLGPAFGAVARPSLIPLPSHVPPGGGSPVVWGAALLQAGNTIYVYGTQTPDPAVPNRQLYLAKVQASRLTDFAAWQFYAGGGQWAASEQNAQPVQPSGSTLSVSSGFSVLRIGSRYWLIQAGVQAGSQDIDAYPAATPWGPFDPAAGLVLFHNTEIGLNAAHDYRIMYEARAEPAVSTSRALVISYNVNSEGVTTGCVPMSAFTNTVTQPRFITVPVTAFTTAASGTPAGGLASGVATGAPAYPQIVRQDPSQWFDGWDYPGGCPPVPAVTAVRAQPQPGGVALSWPDAGLGVRYHVYLLDPGATNYTLATNSRSASTVLSGLHSGTYTASVVPANLRGGTGPAAQVTFTVP